MAFFATLYAVLCGHPVPPLPRDFEALAIEPYILHQNDCSNKAGRYARALLNAGYEAHVVLVQPTHPPGVGLHAVVLVGDLYCDPSTGRVSRSVSDFGTIQSVCTARQLMYDEELA
jgi:hypothetical protein